MPKDNNKEKAFRRVRFDPLHTESGSSVNAPPTFTIELPTIATPIVPSIPTVSTTAILAPQPTLPAQVALNVGAMGAHQNIRQGEAVSSPYCTDEFCQMCMLQAQVQVPPDAANNQQYTTAGPALKLYVRPVVPAQSQGQPQPQICFPPQPQASLLQLSQAHFQPQPGPHNQPSQPYPIPGIPDSSLYGAPVVGAPKNQTADAQGASPLASWPLGHPPAFLENKERYELLQLTRANYFDKPTGIWPPTVQRHPESGLFEKVTGHPHAQTPLLDIELCQISTSKIGEHGKDGFRWVVLLLPNMSFKRLVNPELDSIIRLPSLDRQCAWLIDPCARMEGREFLQFLDPETLMLRRKLHLRSLVKVSCEHMLDTEKLIQKMEGDKGWKNVICCSVIGVTDPHSLALGTGLWATALSQLAYGDLREINQTLTVLRSIIGTELESIGSRQLGLPFLHPGRFKKPAAN